MKKFSLIFIFISVLGLLYGASFTHTYNFDLPEIVTENGESLINFERSVNIGDEGNPLIPHFNADLLLPQDCDLSEIKIISAQFETIDQPIYLKPAGKNYPLSQPLPNDYQLTPNPEVYNSENVFPSSIIAYENTNYLAGHSIGSFSIRPVRYYPKESKIEVLRSITIEVDTKISRNSNLREMLKDNSLIHNRLNRIVDNPEAINNYAYTETTRDVDVDLLLITSQNLQNAFNDYVEYKRSTGFITEVALVEDIENDYAGADLQEKIRNCITDYYINNNLQYVILGGDADPQNSSNNIIPHRGFYAFVGNTIDYDIPSDLYYSGLDGTWNDDNDNVWGEAGEEDIFAEVLVGRICVDSPAEVENQTHKLYMYQEEPVIEDVEKALLLGEYLWTATYGGMYMDELVGTVSTNGYTTTGISDNFTINTLYEQNSTWGASNVYNQFNNVGINQLHHLGHSNTDYNMHLYNYNVTTSNFTNDGVTRGYPIAYSQGCYAGSFDNRSTNVGSYMSDCIAEQLTVIETAEAAFIANSRYGWGMQGSTNGASQFFHRQYVDAIFNEGITTMGGANSDSKEDNSANIQAQQVIRWVAYEATLFGDPTLDVRTAAPTDLVVTHTPAIPIGTSEISFTTSATNARIALVQNGELIGRAITDEFGSATLTTINPISSPDNITVSVVAHDKNRYFGEIFVQTDQPYVLVENVEIDDLDGNGQADYSEEINLNVTMTNLGTEPATNVNVEISSDNEFITINQNTNNFGNIAAGESSTIDAAFTVTVDSYVPDLENVLIIVTATGDGYDDWTSSFNLTLNAPILENEEILLNDSAGNANGFIDPGETVQLTLPTSNIGHSTSPNAIAILTTNNDNVTITPADFELGEIAPDETANAIFEVTVGDDVEIGSNIIFEYTVQAGDFSITKTYSHPVGLIIEDFESGDFSMFEWDLSNPTFEISDGAISGTYCMKSEDITDNQDAMISINMDVLADGEISFFRKVSCEDDSNNNYDYLAFYIDGNLQQKWDGEEGWVEVSFDVTSGNHTFLWKYHKDGAVSSGADACWVDKITFPSCSIELPPTLSVNVYSFDLEMLVNETHDETITISNIGTGELTYEFDYLPAWITTSSETGTLGAGEAEDVTLTFDTTDLAGITYNSTIVIIDEYDHEITIPVTLDVDATDTDDMVPLTTQLNGNYPNPFNPTTTISFDLAKDSNVTLDIYNIKGQKVNTLVNDHLDAGYHKITWNGLDNSGKKVSSGIFFYRFQTGEYSKTQKMMMLK